MALALVTLVALPSEAKAGYQTKVCVFLPIEPVADRDNGYDDWGHGTYHEGSHYLRARRMDIELDYQNFTLDGDGCIYVGHLDPGTYTLRFQSQSGSFPGSNLLDIRNRNGNILWYSAPDVTFPDYASTVNVWVNTDSPMKRLYAYYAHAMETRYRGAMSSGHIRVWNNADQCDAGDGNVFTCTTGISGTMDIAFDSNWHTKRKYTMAHEYGHASLRIVTGQD